MILRWEQIEFDGDKKKNMFVLAPDVVDGGRCIGADLEVLELRGLRGADALETGGRQTDFQRVDRRQHLAQRGHSFLVGQLE